MLNWADSFSTKKARFWVKMPDKSVKQGTDVKIWQWAISDQVIASEHGKLQVYLNHARKRKKAPELDNNKNTHIQNGLKGRAMQTG